MTAVHFFILFLEALLGFVFGGAFLKREKGFNLVLPIVFSGISAIAQLLLDLINAPAAGQMLLAAAVLVLFMKFFYSGSDARKVFTVVSYCFILFICDLIAYTLFTFSEGAPSARLFDEKYLHAAVTVILSRIILILICITIYLMIRQRNSPYARFSMVFSLAATGILFFIFALFFSDIRSNNNDNHAAFMYFFILLFMIIAAIYAGIAGFLSSRERRKRFLITKQQNRMLERSLREQENTFALWRKSVHDYKNTVLALDAMLENGELDKLKAYLEHEKQSFMHRAEYIRSGNGTVDTVLNTKYAAALDNGITFTVNASLPRRCCISDIHLASVIGNLIDNAIEASINEDDPFIDIKIAEVQGFLMIKIVNRCSAPPADLSTTKAESLYHGIGLQSIRDTVAEYDGQFDLTFESGKACASVMIPVQ